MESNEMIEVREIDLGAVFRKVFRHWKMMLIWSMVGAIVGFGIAKSIPRTYTVVSKVSPELSYRQSSITSLAAMAGITNNMLNRGASPNCLSRYHLLSGVYDKTAWYPGQFREM